MKLLIDTHILVWIVLDDPRLSAAQRAVLSDPDNDIILSAANAYELAHLQQLRRIPLEEPIDKLQELVGFELEDLPALVWSKVVDLPDIHRDPLDRLLVAHALVTGMTLVSADECIRRYPVTVV
ncbi:type II toxin-antitoxin system VapC family toxin [Novosphingobium taihuense]|uniref:PIN domain nuclease of toxin-antitoxin system n=1 Tax=Novosphingobium taihuense TaxID=260085 RepID=A0A7W7A9A9_9SPHN|nr:type II toxin-antitoxin system VapC family toxin [Novosphingobium taihuense]MBB4612808.1 PIN domain nuclease of toxin-antitoxin system [Novosphingobium taihuense]TWH80281.1 PIN domain nuclease of toxin-antitoxin system [Novosphingobium taihuense]